MSNTTTNPTRKKNQKRFNIHINRNREDFYYDEVRRWLQANIGPTWKDGDLIWTVRGRYYDTKHRRMLNNEQNVYSFRHEKDALLFALRWAK